MQLGRCPIAIQARSTRVCRAEWTSIATASPRMRRTHGGFGQYPGQYGMAVLSRYPIEASQVRSFQNLKWSEMPGALVPQDPKSSEHYYPADVWSKLRLSSKSFWDVPIKTPQGMLSVLASHPTPPAFDGDEDRNGCRNHDEIRLLHDYIERSGKDYLVDDQGKHGGLAADRDFVIVGDLNSDPVDGGSRQEAIVQLLSSTEVARGRVPRSAGAEAAAERQGKANKTHRGDPAEDTADFSDNAVGNLRADYVLPGKRFQIAQSGVFWPRLEDVSPQLRESMKQCLEASDHHLVWVDVR
ncbi:MAG: endonuclease/exonuclease/phosphatase family protein [Pirellulales bacterium]